MAPHYQLFRITIQNDIFENSENPQYKPGHTADDLEMGIVTAEYYVETEGGMEHAMIRAQDMNRAKYEDLESHVSLDLKNPPIYCSSEIKKAELLEGVLIKAGEVIK